MVILVKVVLTCFRLIENYETMSFFLSHYSGDWDEPTPKLSQDTDSFSPNEKWDLINW